ncbi:MAG: glycerophosphodiester phosphodiesterase [Planctomycetota bacterium]|nr:glycerophosphodiester phosphodiesterase [Planctomycetota bacterium]
MSISKLLILLLILSFTNHAVSQSPLIVAHRGASYDAPENTIPAFKLAWDQHADAIEGDFYLTKDQKIVCIHNKTTGKYSSQDLSVSSSTLAELRKLDVGSYKHKKYKDVRIPSIREVFATVPPGKKIYVEIKCGPEIIPFLTREIDHSDLSADQVIVISFNSEVIKEFKKQTSKHKAYWLSGFKTQKGSASPSFELVVKTLKDIQADGFSSTQTRQDRNFIKAIQSEGFEYHVWTVNAPKIAQQFMDWGAQSITTDRPQFIRKAIENEYSNKD